MTKTQVVLALMATGVPMTQKEIAKVTGWDGALASHILWNMKRAGYIQLAPSCYAITPEGLKHAGTRGAGHKSGKYQNRKARLAELEIRDAEKPRDAYSVLQSARSQPNSVFAMGTA